MDNRIIVTLNKHIVVLFPDELQKLLLLDQDLYIKAIGRGKGLKRAQAVERRSNRYNQEK